MRGDGWEIFVVSTGGGGSHDEINSSKSQFPLRSTVLSEEKHFFLGLIFYVR